MTNKKRIEFDSLGSKKIDQNKLDGKNTTNLLATENAGENVEQYQEKMLNDQAPHVLLQGSPFRWKQLTSYLL